jgi:hypothetical protein
MIVIHQENVAGHGDVSSQVNAILSGDLDFTSNLAALFQNDYRFVGLRNFRNVKPGATIDEYGISDLYLG